MPSRWSAGQAGYSAIPPMATGRSALSWPNGTSRCWLPSRRARSWRGFGKHDFAIDLENGTVGCPAGHTVQIGVSAKGFRQASFSAKVCGACPLKARCCPGRARRQVKLGEHDELLLAARRALADPDTAERLRRGRPRIERLVGLLAHRYGARKSRYIGIAKARLQATWAAALVNLNPIGHRLASHTA